MFYCTFKGDKSGDEPRWDLFLWNPQRPVQSHPTVGECSYSFTVLQVLQFIGTQPAFVAGGPRTVCGQEINWGWGWRDTQHRFAVSTGRWQVLERPLGPSPSRARPSDQAHALHTQETYTEPLRSRYLREPSLPEVLRSPGVPRRPARLRDGAATPESTVGRAPPPGPAAGPGLGGHVPAPRRAAPLRAEPPRAAGDAGGGGRPDPPAPCGSPASWRRLCCASAACCCSICWPPAPPPPRARRPRPPRPPAPPRRWPAGSRGSAGARRGGALPVAANSPAPGNGSGADSAGRGSSQDPRVSGRRPTRDRSPPHARPVPVPAPAGPLLPSAGPAALGCAQPHACPRPPAPWVRSAAALSWCLFAARSLGASLPQVLLPSPLPGIADEKPLCKLRWV